MLFPNKMDRIIKREPKHESEVINNGFELDREASPQRGVEKEWTEDSVRQQVLRLACPPKLLGNPSHFWERGIRIPHC